MPELPEVHTTATYLNKLIRGKTIKDTWSDFAKPIYKGKQHIKNSEYFTWFSAEVKGKKIIKVDRRAKNVLIHLSNKKVILIHMKMTGHLLYGKYEKTIVDHTEKWVAIAPEPLKDPFNQFIHLVFTLSDGKSLALSDMRKFAKVLLIEDKESVLRHLEDLGPEPLEKDFTFEVFKKQLSLRPKGKIKLILMDQTIISGIGNIYSDEILWESSVRPTRNVDSLSPQELKRIYSSIKTILKKAITKGGDSMSDYRNPLGEKGSYQFSHKAYRRTGLPCPKKGCNGVIARIKMGGRSAHFCPQHQK